MKRIACFALAALPLLAMACVKEDPNAGITSVGGGDYDNAAIARGELAVDPKSRLVTAPVTVIIDPITVKINKREEAERIIQFYGVTYPDKDKYPELYASALGFLKEHVGDQFSVQIKTLPGTKLSNYRLKGHIMVPAKGGGKLSITQSMLSRGLLMLNKRDEVPNTEEALGFRQRQKEAYDARRGIWKYVRAKQD